MTSCDLHGTEHTGFCLSFLVMRKSCQTDVPRAELTQANSLLSPQSGLIQGRKAGERAGLPAGKHPSALLRIRRGSWPPSSSPGSGTRDTRSLCFWWPQASLLPLRPSHRRLRLHVASPEFVSSMAPPDADPAAGLGPHPPPRLLQQDQRVTDRTHQGAPSGGHADGQGPDPEQSDTGVVLGSEHRGGKSDRHGGLTLGNPPLSSVGFTGGVPSLGAASVLPVQTPQGQACGH